MLNNGKASSGKRSRHVDIRYFFMKKRFDRGEFQVKYCPTELMIEDFFTKLSKGVFLKDLVG